MASAKDIDLSIMSRNELEELRKEVDKALADYETKQRQAALAEAQRVAQERGYSLDQLLGKKNGRKKTAPQPPRYQHPENPSLTWSGRGRQPVWVKEHIEAGGSKEDLAIT